MQLKNVSIHAPARGATYDLPIPAQLFALFQSTRPRGARPSVSRQAQSPGYVSIHAPARGATGDNAGFYVKPSSFQSTRPRGARRMVLSATFAGVAFQSTRPRGARLNTYIDGYAKWFGVSIHAPARGATRAVSARWVGLAQVSIHAPARGATLRLAVGKRGVQLFQSTRPRGARPQYQ